MYNLTEGIKTELNKKTDIKVISFDIFDTILFRMVRKPVDVFERVGKLAQEQKKLPQHVSPIIYKNIRIEAEKQARRKSQKCNHHREVILEDIIENLPPYCGENREMLLQLELQAERELCYLNPDIYEVMEYLKSRNYRVILVSDMYLSGDRILDLLTYNGFSIDIIDKVYVSCECRQNKSSGDLYQHVLTDMNLLPEELLHIGDNYMSDVINANYFGINTIYYDVLNSDKYMSLQLEEMKYGNLLPELYSLRRYVADKGECYDSEEKFWFQMGALVLGPLMTGFTEYILDVADKENIEHIYPLMREGMIISRLLRKAAEHRQREYRIEPMYISRKAAFLPALSEFGEEEYEEVIRILQNGGTIRDLFNMLDLDPEAEVQDLLEISIQELRKHPDSQNRIKKVLFSKDVQQKIMKNIECKYENIMGYLGSLDIKKRFLTADIGYGGTMQKAINCLLRKAFGYADCIHLLAIGSNQCLEKIFDHVDIRGFAGNCGEYENSEYDMIQRIYLLEQFLLCGIGTTVGYEEKNNRYVPILKQIKGVNNEQWTKVEITQKGMMFFQKVYLDLKKRKPLIETTFNERSSLRELVLRLITLPTEEEAGFLGDLTWDNNYGKLNTDRFCSKEDMERVKEIGVPAFCQEQNLRENMWLEGVVTQVQPYYYLNQVLEMKASTYEQSVMKIVKNILQSNPGEVIVVGAGDVGRTLQKYLKLYGIRIEAFTDNNVKLQGSVINGIPVRTLRDEFKSGHYVIASFAYADEIYEQIRELKGMDVKVYRN